MSRKGSQKGKMLNPHAASQPVEPCLGDWIERPDGRVAQYVRENEEDGQHNARHFRTVDTLGLMLRNGTITPQMHGAGQQFSQEFYAAHLTGPKPPNLERIGSSSMAESMTERCAFAIKRVTQALDAVGGVSSPAGSALWFVAGLGLSVREWAFREGWSGKAISVHEAKGMLVAGLGMLARYYGYDRGGIHPRCDQPVGSPAGFP